MGMKPILFPRPGMESLDDHEDYDISDFELAAASDALEEYWNNEKLVTGNFKGIRYHKVSDKIKEKIGL